MIINRSGIAIRLEIDNIRVMGRATQGVRLINLKNGDQIASVAKIEVSDEERELANAEDAEIENNDNLTNEGEEATEE